MTSKDYTANAQVPPDHVFEKVNLARRANLINHMEFFQDVVSGNIKLSNDSIGDTFTSWKVGGQDFYAYGLSV